MGCCAYIIAATTPTTPEIALVAMAHLGDKSAYFDQPILKYISQVAQPSLCHPISRQWSLLTVFLAIYHQAGNGDPGSLLPAGTVASAK